MTALTTTTPGAPDYPVRFDVDYPEEPRNRATVFFRLLLVIPILVISALLQGTGGADFDREPRPGEANAGAVAATGGVVVAPTVLMLLFRRKYPRWWFDWNLELTRFGTRIGAYALLLRDEYPSTDEEQAVHIDIEYPDAQQLNRWLPLVKILLAIPHWIVLFLLMVGVFFAVVFAWFAILVTGRFPRGLFDFVVGVGRWLTRVSAYALLLTTDRYPPFSTR